MKTLDYRKLDAFAVNGSMGNPAACIYLHVDETLSDDEMKAIAYQHKGFVSEMVYCKPDINLMFDLVYFSSECEVAFCGHGTIACMYNLIQDTPELLMESELFVRTRNMGTLTVHNKILDQDAVYITAPEAQHLGTKLSAEVIAAQLGIATDRLSGKLPVDMINAGLNTLLVPLETLEDEIHLTPDEKSLKAFCEDNGIDIVLVFSMETSAKSSFVHSRVFAPRFGYLEDPATGSGNSALGNYLLKHQLWNGDPIAVEQGGADMPAYNIVQLMTMQGQVLFGGRATARIVGEYLI